MDNSRAKPQETAWGARLPEDASYFSIGAGALILRERSQELFSLDPFGAALWRGLSKAEPLVDTIRDCQQAFQLTEERSRLLAQEALAGWRRLKLLGETAEFSGRIEDPTGFRSAPLVADRISRCSFRHCFVRIGALTLRISCQDPGWVEKLADEFSGCVTDEGPFAAEIHLFEQGERIVVCRASRLCWKLASEDELVPAVYGALLQETIRWSRFSFCFHAALLERDGSQILLPGSAGSGKSTLAMGLCHSGFGYLTDEIAMLTSSGFGPFPLPITLKRGSWPVARAGEGKLGSPHRRGDGKWVRYWTPPRKSRAPRAELSTVVFPLFREGAPTSIRPVDSVSAAARLLKDCIAVQPSFSEDSVRPFAESIHAADCYELELGCLEDGIAAVMEVVGSRD